MTFVTTASAFDTVVDYPEDKKAEKYFENMTELDGLLFLMFAHSRFTLVSRILKDCGATLDDLNLHNLYLNYTNYDSRFEQNHQSLTRSFQAKVLKDGEGVLDIPVFAHMSLDYVLPMAYLNHTMFSQYLDSNIFGLNGVYLRWAYKQVKDKTLPDSIPLDPEFFKRMTPEYFNDMLEVVSEDQINWYKANCKELKLKFIVDPSNTDEKGNLLSDPNCLFTGHISVPVPKSVVSYISQGGDEITKVSALHQYGELLFEDIYGDFDAERIVRPLESVVEATEGVIKEVKLSNDDNIMLNTEGTLEYIPEVRDLKKYNELRKSIGTKTKDGIEITLDTLAKVETNMPIYTDWRLGYFMYTSTNGSMARTSLSGGQPANPNHYKNLISTKSAKVLTNFNNAITDSFSFCKANNLVEDLLDLIEVDEILTLFPQSRREQILTTLKEEKLTVSVINVLMESGINGATNIGTSSSISKDLGSLLVYIRVLAKSIMATLGDVADIDTCDAESIATEDLCPEYYFRYPVYNVIGRILTKVAQFNDYDAYIKRVGVARAMRTIPYIIIGSKYELSEINAFDKEYRATLGLNLPQDNYEVAPLHNIKDGVFFLPHQVRANHHLTQENDNAVLDVAAGGGKTALAITDALRHTAQGRRVAVVCPNYLMRNYVEDATFFTEGKLNVICINTEVYNQYGEEKLAEMITDAPPNTLFVLGLNMFSQGKNIKFNYAGADVTINQIVEFLRSFTWDVVIMDESHMLANTSSNRSEHLLRFLGVAKYRRELTGTFINNTCMDAFGQAKYLNPSILGDEEEFLEQYAAVYSGSKVISWKPKAEQEIKQKIASNIDFVSVRRKEWAALLPQKRESFHFVDLSEQQYKVYQAILTDVVDEIMKDPVLKAALDKANEDDDAESVAIEAMLKRYLARIERFLCACDLDEIGKTLLTGDELISPKVTKTIELLEEHFKDPELSKGKVLIFTSYRDSAASIYNNLPPKFKKMALLYEASRKEELIPIMKKDPNVKIVIGVEQSLNTGHNFQMFSRLIREESIWNPGTLDQAESRLNRPDPKNKDNKRSYIQMDWICTNRTIDVTKTSRLVSKILSAARFNEGTNPLYADIPELPVVSMNLQNILQNNDFETSLSRYLEGYQEYQNAVNKDYQIFRETTQFKEPVNIPNAGVMKGTAYIDVPYIPGMVVPFQKEMGLVSLEDYALDKGVVITETPEIKGHRVHTEFGDGIISSVSARSIKVRLDHGGSVSVNKLTAFLIPDDLEGSVKDNIKSKLGLAEAPKKIKQLKTVEVVEKDVKRKRSNQPADTTDIQLDGEVEVYLSNLNNAVTVMIDSEDMDITPKVAQQLDLMASGPYYYCFCRTHKALRLMLEKLEEKFDIPQDQLDKLYELLETFETGRQKLMNLERASKIELKQFFLQRRRKVPKGELHVFPIIEDGVFWLAAFADNQIEARRLPRLRVPSAKWELDKDGFYFKVFMRKSEARDYVKSLADHGLTVSNMDQVKEDYANIKIRK